MPRKYTEQMTKLVVDIETDGLLPELTRVVCLGTLNCDTGTVRMFRDTEIAEAIQYIDTAGELYLHNGIGFDLPALRKVTGWVPRPTVRVIDTLLWSMFLFSDLRNSDAREYSSEDDDMEEYMGSHSLAAWGARLNCPKGEYSGPWDTWSEALQEYCAQDVVTTDTLRKHLALQSHTVWPALDMEHQFATLTQRMEERGIKFNVDAARELFAELQADLNALCLDISKDIPPEIIQMKTPEYVEVTWPTGEKAKFPTKKIMEIERKRLGYKPKDCVAVNGPVRTKVLPFNPNSRDQVKAYLYNKYGWVSPKLTDAGEKLLGTKPAEELAIEYGSVSEEILRALPYQEGKKFADYFLIKKAAGFIQGSDEEKGWLGLERNGRIHHRMLTIGAVTMRCTHSRPNISQVPGVTVDRATGKPQLGLSGRYGWECRSLFSCDEGRTEVGVDLSGIESRGLAHHLAVIDGGAYVRQVLEGDIHQLNVDAIKSHANFTVGRNPSKGLFYSWCYGGGDMKIGTLVVPMSLEARELYNDKTTYYRRNPKSISQKVWSKAIGKRRRATPEEAAYIDCGNLIRTSFERGIDGLEELLSRLAAACKKGYIRIQDGRHIPVRSPHAALNCLLQSWAAVILKRWVCISDELQKRDEVDYHLMAIIHDEIQADVRNEHVQTYTTNCLEAIKMTEKYYSIRCPLAGEAKVGTNWGDCH